MRKGVSPVVATVLLIAIAVISAVAVWYWVAPLTSAQPTPSTTQSAFIVTNTYKNATSDGCGSLDIMNSGGISILANTFFEVRSYTTGALVTGKFLNISIAIAPGTTINVNLTNVTAYAPSAVSANNSVALGTYILRASPKSAGSISGFADVYFTC